MSSFESSPTRPNPFDRELFMDERHYEPTLVEVVGASVVTPAVAIGGDGGGGDAAGEVADWQLGLSPPVDDAPLGRMSGRMGLSRLEELTLAIDSCKELIVRSAEHSDARRKLVAKLVQLRLQLQELKEGPVEVGEAQRSVCGHQFVLQERAGRNPYCERCVGIIWRLVQPWYRCVVCGYRSHAKCLNVVTRLCAGVRVRESRYVLKICPEVGLAAQKYRCAECRCKLSFSAREPPRLCDYTGLFFCAACHWNDELVIPARVVHNWDFEPRKVSRSSKQLLELMRRKPLIHIERLNPALFNLVDELRLIRKMRQDILLMKCYFICCKEARVMRILWHLKHHQHFVEGADVFSLDDLVELQDGRLETELRVITDVFVGHIKSDCVTCAGNGFVCELCDDAAVIFPFDEFTAVCRHCCAVFHRRCFDRADRLCPRCERRRVRLQSAAARQPSPDSSPERRAAVLSRNPFDDDDDGDALNPFLGD